MGRKPCCDKVGLRRGAWTMEEDQKLINFILINGIQCWRHVPKLAGLKRCGKSCRLRWTNYLRPDLKRGSFTEAEEDQIIQLHSQLGNRWSKIASHFPGRTDNEIKNHWNTGIKKRLKLLGVDPLTHNPLIQHPGQDSSISGVDDDEVNKTIEITDSQEDQHVHLDLSGKDDKKQNSIDEMLNLRENQEDQHVQHLDLSGKDDKKQNSTDEMLNLRESQEDQHVQHLDLSGKDDKKQNSTDEMLNLRESLDGGGGEQMQVGEAKPSSSSRSSSNSFISMDDTHYSTNTEVTELCWDVPIDSLPSWEELYFLSDLMSFVDYP